MKKAACAIILLVAAVFAAAGIFAGCDFTGTVPDYYYSYEIDLTSQTGRKLYDMYDGSAAYVQIACYGRYGNTEYHMRSCESTGVYVTEDGWMALPSEAFVPEKSGGQTAEVIRYAVKVFYFDNSGETLSKQFFFYKEPYGDNAPIDGNVIAGNYGVTLVKLPVEGHKYIPVTDNTAQGAVGERLWLFSAAYGETQAGGLISSVTVAAADVEIRSSSSASYDYVTPYKRADYLVDGNFHKEDIGGAAVNEDGKLVGIIFSRAYSESGSDQSDDIYGKAVMAGAERVADLLEKVGGGANA